MARKSASKFTSTEENNQAEGAESSKPLPKNKSEAIRWAVAAGKVGKEGSEYILREYGMDVSPQHFASIKSGMKKQPSKGKPGRKPKTAVEGYLAPPAARGGAASETKLLAAMELMKPLVDNLGADKVKRIVDLLG